MFIGTHSGSSSIGMVTCDCSVKVKVCGGDQGLDVMSVVLIGPLLKVPAI